MRQKQHVKHVKTGRLPSIFTQTS